MIGLAVTRGADSVSLLPVAAALARSRSVGLLALELVPEDQDSAGQPLVVKLESSNEPVTQAFALAAKAQGLVLELESDDARMGAKPSAAIRFVRSAGSEAKEWLEALRGLKLDCLLIPRPVAAKGDDPTAKLERELFMGAECLAVALRCPEGYSGPIRDICVPLGAPPHHMNRVALHFAESLLKSQQGRIDAIWVEPNRGADARALAARALHREVVRAVGHQSVVEETIIMADDAHEGMAQAVTETCDLVLVGVEDKRALKPWLFGTVSEKLLKHEHAPALAVLREATPFSGRMSDRIQRFIASWIPQLEREDRLALVERLGAHSRWSFDFVTLLSLSTLIASLGLVKSAPAVIIGAMLVAPLMTPLVGLGLALVQGNLALLRSAIRSVAGGFMLAFFLGVMVGLPFVDMPLTAEMLGRAAPDVWDIVIALLSGLAAAYASARPNQSSALAGVAIAAALVPPIATGGLCIAKGSWLLGLRALLLFSANMVAIILGSAVTLWLMGVRSSHAASRSQAWGTVAAIVVFIVAVALAVFLL